MSMLTAPSPNTYKRNRAKLLVIEDNDDQWHFIGQATKQILPELASVRVSTSQEALALIKGWSGQEWELPKLILQDLYLPRNIDGWQLTRQIKAMEVPVSLVPIVILSASVSHTDIEKSYNAGAASYLAKPDDFSGWLTHFQELRSYWLETVTLPPSQFFL